MASIKSGLCFTEFMIPIALLKIPNQRTNGPVNAYLLSGPSKSKKHTNPKANLDLDYS